MATQTVIETVNTLHCPNCGMLFGITEDFEKRRRDDHADFYCPRGHSMSYKAETEAERLKRQLQQRTDELSRARAYHDQREADLQERIRTRDRRIGGYKSVVTRTKRKIAAGRCPCCSHQFKDLESHMKNRHPNWNPDRAAEAVGDKQ